MPSVATDVKEIFVVHVGLKGFEASTIVRRWIIDDLEEPIPTNEFRIYRSVSMARVDWLGTKRIYDRSQLPWKEGKQDYTIVEVWV